MINTRWLRKNRVVYNKATGDFAILVHTPGPGSWNTLKSDGSYAITSSKAIAINYTNMASTLYGLPKPDPTEFGYAAQRMLDRIDKLPVTTPWAAEVQRDLKRAITSMGGGIAAAKVAEAPTAPPTPVSRVTAEFKVPVYDPESFWYDSDDDTQLYEDFIKMRQANHPINLLIAGPSGSGKTEGVIRLGMRLGIPVHVVNCQAITTPEKWIGQMMATIADGTYFEPSQHIQWVERTHPDCAESDYCILLYDEITRLRPELNNMTYSLFDTQRGLEVPQMGRRVQMSQKNMVVATANLGAAFTGTHTQDRAFRERFSLTMERPFPPSSSEIKILTSATGISNADAETLVRIAEVSRNLWEQEEIDSPISTRTLKAWALLVAGGYSVKKAAQYTVIPLYSNDGGLASDRTKVSSMIEGKAY